MVYRKHSLAIVIGCVAIAATVGCGVMQETIEDAPIATLESAPEFVLGESPGLVASGLIPGAEYQIEAERTDPFDRMWSATARFRASASGRIDVSRDEPSAGSYDGVDGFGLLWSMTMSSSSDEEGVAPQPRDYHGLQFRLSDAKSVLASSRSRQWIIPPDIRRQPVGDGLTAELFLPQEVGPNYPAVVVLGGSGGGKGWATRTAALLAHDGLAAMALSYFGDEGLPTHLAQVPIEPVVHALDVLAAHAEVDYGRVGLVGYSKGAELAMFVASRRRDVRAVVAISPASAVFQGFKPPEYPVVSSWSADGAEVPFVPNAYDDKFFETYDGMYLWYRTLAQPEAMDVAALPAERINGDILMLSGADDRIWPATLMAAQVLGRLHVADFGHMAKHLPFREAGHGIAVPPGEPTTDVAERLGGTPAGNARARTHGWSAIQSFLSDSLTGLDKK